MTPDRLRISLPFSDVPYSCGHLHEHAHTHTCKNACKSKQALDKMMNGFHLQATGERDRHFYPSANSCFRQNNKWLNDIVSCTPWLQNGNGSTVLRQQLQMAHLYNHPLFLSLVLSAVHPHRPWHISKMD